MRLEALIALYFRSVPRERCRQRQLFPRSSVAHDVSVLPAFVGLISQIDRSLGHGAALVKAILRKRPEWIPVKIAHPNEFILAAVARP